MTKYDPEKINGYKIDLADLENIYNTLNKLNNLERRKLPGLVKGREDVILFGILIYWAIMVKFSFSVVIASDRGLRYGYLKWLEINKEI
jgi:exopolyphosphatase/guanosine-5'-triphosphate,3'-diphosphate pyrophosphatase